MELAASFCHARLSAKIAHLRRGEEKRNDKTLSGKAGFSGVRD
jgi:hypothetical protein